MTLSIPLPRGTGQRKGVTRLRASDYCTRWQPALSHGLIGGWKITLSELPTSHLFSRAFLLASGRAPSCSYLSVSRETLTVKAL